jgi:hypothetical protein
VIADVAASIAVRDRIGVGQVPVQELQGNSAITKRSFRFNKLRGGNSDVI